ncbi:hypothetical protein AVEN_119891-1 [Araneus ventricosus]|uniref:Uncharacterized protein n=1 Tax=Araneus ventricosus TaxID=182803 RepID=A0A4Y2QEY2_ARAVE|nr:hypothetical protein AVEN_142731-1 [Araneus ventricosus]GBN61628.1 hypothetical protein AVEN_123564-1 [Araneus ventricosus]GBN61662.1 hypothetical protein AVEN_119891-1 [Araneus ventricosus]
MHKDGLIHEKIHTPTKFLVHTTNVQCVRLSSPGTHPNGNPVPSRRSIACFLQCPSQQQCLQRCWHWGYINFDLHITPQEEITWREIWRPGGELATEEHQPDHRGLSSDVTVLC